MKIDFKSAITGILAYIEQFIYPTLTNVQEILARTAVGVITENPDALMERLTNNQFVQLMGVIDCDGMVDVERICKHLKEQIARKGKLDIQLKLLKLNYTFYATDVDLLYTTIYKEKVDR